MLVGLIHVVVLSGYNIGVVSDWVLRLFQLVLPRRVIGDEHGAEPGRLGGIDVRPRRIADHPRLTGFETVLGQEAVADEPEQAMVEVVAAELGVAVAGEDLDDPLLDLRDRDVEGPPPRS